MSASRPKPTRTYYYRGLIERGPRYRWANGYSAGSPGGRIEYPWLTRRECQQDAESMGCSAVFVRDHKNNKVSEEDK
jgi:hypothetical protein